MGYDYIFLTKVWCLWTIKLRVWFKSLHFNRGYISITFIQSHTPKESKRNDLQHTYVRACVVCVCVVFFWSLLMHSCFLSHCLQYYLPRDNALCIVISKVTCSELWDLCFTRMYSTCISDLMQMKQYCCSETKETDKPKMYCYTALKSFQRFKVQLFCKTTNQLWDKQILTYIFGTNSLRDAY